MEKAHAYLYVCLFVRTNFLEKNGEEKQDITVPVLSKIYDNYKIT